MKRKYLLFDIDGTLVNPDGAGRLAFEASCSESGLDPALIHNCYIAGHTDRRIVHDLLRASGKPEAEFNVFFHHVRRVYPPHLQRQLQERRSLRVYPGVHELLQACTRHPEIELALLSGNMPEAARIKLKYSSLWDFFHWGVFGDLADERIDLAAAALQHISAGRTVRHEDIFVIGDTVQDIICGRSIGATTVSLASDFIPEAELLSAKPDLLLHRIDELIPILGL